MSKRILSFLLLTFLVVLFGGVLGDSVPALAQADGVAEVGARAGFGDASLPEIVANLIRAALGMLGVVALVLVIYGGFTWMTSGGNEEKIARAKRILISAGIGLGIILLSFAITSFVLNSILGATNGTGSGGPGGDGSGGGIGGLGGGSGATFVVTKVEPTGEVAIRNIVVSATLSRTIDESTANNALVIRTKATGEVVPGTVTVSGNRLKFVPEALCPEPNADRRCFVENTAYTVTVENTLKSANGKRIDCSGGRCLAEFTSGSIVDTENPRAEFIVPTVGTQLATNAVAPIRVDATDDAGVAVGVFTVDGAFIDSVTGTGEDPKAVSLLSAWDTTGYQDASPYTIGISVEDLAGNTVEETVRVSIGPLHCYNNVIDPSEGETGEDCGGVCGSCGGEVCTQNSDCSSGVCTNGVCAESAGTEGAPVLSALSPSAGPIKQYVTLNGAFFGARTGTVRFTNVSTGDTAVADVTFPEACSEDYWASTQVTVMVPSSYTNGLRVVEAPHTLTLVRYDGRVSNTLPFVITSGTPTPGICALSPTQALQGANVIVHGSGFGASTASLFFADDVSATVRSWSDAQITTTVPENARTGGVFVELADGRESNRMTFTVGSAGETSTGVGESAYVWHFSTGNLANIPSLVVACSEDRLSAVPNNVFTNGACVNAEVYAEFTTRMLPSSLKEGETIYVERCQTERCANGQKVDGELSLSTSPDRTAFSWVPKNGAMLEPGTVYRVVVTKDVQSDTGILAGADSQFTFTTRESAELCAVDRVRVLPAIESLNALNETSEFRAFAGTNTCQVLRGDDMNWFWSIDESVASLEAGACSMITGEQCAVATALSEGRTEVVAEERTSRKSDSAQLEVNFTDPYVVQVWPLASCTEACVNIEVGAEFNLSMDQAIESAGGVRLQECQNELCLSFTRTVTDRARCIPSASGEPCKQIAFVLDGPLTADKYYRAVISGEAQSESGVSLTRLNYATDYSWVFKTKATNIECAVSRISLEPELRVLSEIGATQEYAVQAFGSGDSCSVAGQRLNADSVTWSWEQPIIDEEGVAEFVSPAGASLIDSDRGSIAPGCSASCLPLGSTALSAICGNGTIEVGEECEDGNGVSGDGCSSMCLREGADHIGICGDGTLNRGANGSGEDCDDGNTVSGDGCSSLCLNEGSRSSVGSACGNGSVGYLATLGGEDCDDGNRRSGDGCSSICLNEGSPSQLDVFAVCGNGRIESPYESCDDGNAVSGDGCSSSCVREGGNIVGFCGNNELDRTASGAGEDCDDGNKINGDGCSSSCLLEGSSLSYAVPAICGDGVQSVFEYPGCEVGLAGDGREDPLQLARIADGASARVSEETNRASATVRVAASAYNLADEASLTLTCSAQSDLDCSDPQTHGVGANACCSLRPTVTLYPNGQDVCRNASLYGTFTQEMSTTSFENNVFLVLSLNEVTNQTCPADHSILVEGDLVRGGGSIFGRAIRGLKLLVRGENVRAIEAGLCVLPISSVSQEANEDTTTDVSFHYRALLQPNAQYRLEVLSDRTTTNDRGEEVTVPGVKNALGVSMRSDAGTIFETGSEVCSLDQIEVSDTSRTNPGVFTATGERHVFKATPVSYSRGRRIPIEPIENVYDWTWGEWREDSRGEIVLVDEEAGPRAEIVAGNASGSAKVVAQAKITTSPGSDLNTTVAGTRTVTTSVCANPWPSRDLFPFIDDGSSKNAMIDEGAGWMNFSMHYCRDAGDRAVITDDLPSLSIIAPTDTESPTVLKEYLLRVNDDATNDAIGIRISANPTYLSPMEWYKAQGFTGSPTSRVLDGFEAVQDGRTVYVAAPNFTASRATYPNMYVISYNEGASEATRAIHEQILENFRFVTNLESTGLCFNDGEYTATTCSSNRDCNVSAGEVCADEKARLARDMRRLTDLRSVELALQSYATKNGRCSVTTDRACTSSLECPQGEQCVSAVPTVASGSFVRGLASSAWPTWSTPLGNEIGTTLPVDPLNSYASCGNSAYPNQDPSTCFDERTSHYICPNDSYVYHYRARGPFDYELTAELEYDEATWIYPIDVGNKNRLTVAGSNSIGDGFIGTSVMCEGAVYGETSLCGDGVVGSAEYCEIGQQGSAVPCDTNGDGTLDGLRAQICNATCSAFVANTSAACVPATCGNGVIDGVGEQCDDGAQNGEYGYCGASCTYATALYCGDGTVGAGEVCDCGDGTNGRAFGGGLCGGVANGEYGSNPAGTCAWDCSGPAPFCGNAVIEPGEQCDGNTESWDGKLCVRGVFAGMPCQSSDDCNGNSCGGPAIRNECPVSTVCVSGDPAKRGSICSVDADCSSAGAQDGDCSANPVQTTRTRICNDDGSAGDLCTWTTDRGYIGIECKGPITCGNGTLDAGEACDDGNGNNTDACTNECRLNVCGDGYVHSGIEACDAGDQNGEMCRSSYGSTCNYCSTSCQFVATSGAYCGDGIRNGGEYCDQSDIPYVFISEGGDIFSTCEPSQVGDGFIDQGTNYVCARVGMCNGGANNGSYCSPTSGTSFANCAIGGGVCEFGACDASCSLACPTSTSPSLLRISTNLSGSRTETSAEFNSYTTLSEGRSSLFTPTFGSLVVPACRVATTPVADIDFLFEGGDAKVAIVVDRTSQSGRRQPSRLSVEKDIATRIVNTVFADEDLDAKVALYSYPTTAPAARVSRDSVVCSADGFCGESSQTALLNLIQGYTSLSSSYGAGDMNSALSSAWRGLNTNWNGEKRAIILLSYGQHASGQGPDDALSSSYNLPQNGTLIESIRNDGVSVFTVSVEPNLFVSTPSPQANMVRWSSGYMNPGTGIDPDTGIDYAYTVQYTSNPPPLADGIEDMVTRLLASIRFLFIVNGVETNGIVREGNSVELPWPEGFTCDEDRSQTVPFRFYFDDETATGDPGTVRIQNVKFNICTP